MSSYTQADLDALDRAIKLGVVRVEYKDRNVTYRSLDEMLRIRVLMIGELGIRRPTRSRASLDMELD